LDKVMPITPPGQRDFFSALLELALAAERLACAAPNAAQV